jgi:hypothetical protein
MKEQEYIPLGDLVDGDIYTLRSRNLRIGIYQADAKAFIGIRRKWGSRFLDQELHWDVGEPYGTARPIKLAQAGDPETQQLPAIQNLDADKRTRLFDRLSELQESLEPEPGRR